MKEKIFLRIEKGGVNEQYWSTLVELCDRLALSPTKAILWSLVYTLQNLRKEKQNE